MWSKWRASAMRRWLLDKPGYAIAIYVGVVGVVLVALGVAMFPRPAVSPRPERVELDAYDEVAIPYLDYSVDRLTESRYRIRVTIWVTDSAKGVRSGDPSVFVILPTGQKFIGQKASEKRYGHWRVDASIHVAPSGEAIYKGAAAFEVRGSDFGYGATDEHVVVVRPTLGGTLDKDSELTVTYPVPNSDKLEWQQNPPDSSTKNTNRWEYFWSQGGVGESTALNVVLEGQSQFRGFLAAAFLALGASALFVVIPEVVRERARTRAALSKKPR
jgi:hypothetical protein